MDRRRQQRVFVDLPVRIWGMDAHSRPFSQPASLHTICGRGASLEGINVQLKPGDVIDLQYEGMKAQFRIAWLGIRGTEREGEVGVESLSAEIRLWEVAPPLCSAAAGQG